MTQDPSGPVEKTCESCGNTFTCGAHVPGKCWCLELPRVMPVVEGTSCKCPDCLKKEIETKVGN